MSAEARELTPCSQSPCAATVGPDVCHEPIPITSGGTSRWPEQGVVWRFERTGHQAGQPFKDNEIPAMVESVQDAIEFAIANAPVDPDRIGMIGYSMGAYIAFFGDDANRRAVLQKVLEGDQIRMRLMSHPVPAPRANPRRIANWGPMLLGILCLGIGLVFAIGAFVDLDYMDANHLDTWPPTVIMEIGVAVILAVFGPWCLLHGIRAPGRQK